MVVDCTVVDVVAGAFDVSDSVLVDELVVSAELVVDNVVDDANTDDVESSSDETDVVKDVKLIEVGAADWVVDTSTVVLELRVVLSDNIDVVDPVLIVVLAIA